MGANAVTTVPVYTAGEVLTAADLNITNSGIPVFATTTTRDAAFGGSGEKTLAEGQFGYIEATNTTQYYDGAAWLALGGKVGQIISTTKTDTFSAAVNTTFSGNVTGLTATITPTSASSSILISGTICTASSLNASYAPIRIMRGATAIGVGTSTGSRTAVTTLAMNETDSASASPLPFNFLDSPATTSATTYALQVYSVGNGTIYVNRSQIDTDTANYYRSISTITVMEILA